MTEGTEKLKLAKDLLHDELTKDPPLNRHRIRCLCRDNPGLIAQSSIRLKLWKILLLGNAIDDLDKKGDLPYNEVPCDEFHVLENDVTRTRAEIEEFRSIIYRKSITIILQEFCKKYSIQYKQGMNEVLAPFIYLSPPTNEPQLEPFILFESFIFRYLERYFCLDDSGYLYKAFRLFHILLLYHDPQLALHLQDNDFPPELYSPQWFLTLFSRSLPMTQVLRLWDMLIAVDDPSFTFFVGLCLLRRLRSSLLLSDSDTLPEILRNLRFKDGDDIDSVMVEAFQLYKITPRCFCRNLRLCCVSSAELSPYPVDINAKVLPNGKVSKEIELNPLDRVMSVQSVRFSLMLSPQELISLLLPMSVNTDGSGDDSVDASLQQFVLIDVRSIEDSESSGAGIIPKALSMEPEFLEQPDALDAWIQHFDGTRGCNICIIDLPPGKASSISLWRRLILGEGDGFVSNNSSVTYGNNWNKSEEVRSIRDLESKYHRDEEEAIAEDKLRPAMMLALALQKAGFSNVCVLDGGFPSLVQQLITLRGTVEPLVINHNSELWEEFLRTSGREKYSLNASKKTSPRATAITGKIELVAKTYADLTELEIAEIALQTALRLGHDHMARILQLKISALTQHLTGLDSSNIVIS